MALDFTSPVPLYHQVAERLRQQLKTERWEPGKQLPGEHDLCRQFGVTRPTVRQALDNLVREGLIMKRRGKGTFVAEPRPAVGFFSMVGTTAAFAAKRMKLETKVLGAEQVTGTPILEDESPARTWLHLERLRSVQRQPCFLEHTWIASNCMPGLEVAELNTRSLYEVMQQRFNLHVVGGVQRFYAVAAEGRTAERLGCKKGAPLLRLTRILDLNGHPASFLVELFVREGPFVLETQLGRNADEIGARVGA